jgi:hypothetical protein
MIGVFLLSHMPENLHCLLLHGDVSMDSHCVDSDEAMKW